MKVQSARESSPACIKGWSPALSLAQLGLQIKDLLLSGAVERDGLHDFSKWSLAISNGHDIVGVYHVCHFCWSLPIRNGTQCCFKHQKWWNVGLIYLTKLDTSGTLWFLDKSKVMTILSTWRQAHTCSELSLRINMWNWSDARKTHPT